MSDVRSVFSLGRRQLLQAGTASLAATAVPACTGTIGDGSLPGPSDGSSSAEPSEAGTSAAPSSADALAEAPPPPPSGDDSAPPGPSDPEAGDPNAGDATAMDDGPMEAGPAETGPTAACIKDGNTYVLPLAKHPELATPGSATVVIDDRFTDVVCGLSGFYVVHVSQGQYAAFSAECTHQCCLANVQGTILSCPCHGSKFDLKTGKVVNGPARINLQSLPVSTDGPNVCVQLK